MIRINIIRQVLFLIIREREIQKVCKSNMRGGEGDVGLAFSVGPDNPAQGTSYKMVATVTLDPGASVGYHVHEDDEEMYHILSGNGTYDDNGQEIEVGPGDVMICPNGQGHSIRNTGSDILIFFAVVNG